MEKAIITDSWESKYVTTLKILWKLIWNLDEKDNFIAKINIAKMSIIRRKQAKEVNNCQFLKNWKSYQRASMASSLGGEKVTDRKREVQYSLH